MKPVKLKRLATALAIAGASAVLVGCGSRNNDSVTTPIIPGTGTIPGTNIPIGSGGCIPINQAIPFTAQGIYFTGTTLAGGFIPGSSQSVGQVVLGGSAQGGPYGRQAVDLTISMNIISAGTQYAGQLPGQYPGGYGQTTNLANATGVIQINPATQQQILTQFGYGGTGLPGYPGYPQQGLPANQQVPCVSGIAFNTGNYNGILYNGTVYLYLNNTQHGVSYPL